MLAQESGDFVNAWQLLGAACKICLALGLHKKTTGSADESSAEAYYCFACCYMNDKGLASMCNPCQLSSILGRPWIMGYSPEKTSLIAAIWQFHPCWK